MDFTIRKLFVHYCVNSFAKYKLKELLLIFFFSAYYAQVAGLYYSISHTDGGFEVFFQYILVCNIAISVLDH